MSAGEQEKVIRAFISTALDRARRYARMQFGHRCLGESCAFISSLALGLVIMTRNSQPVWMPGDDKPVLSGGDPKCIELAYVDHYLNMRAVSGLFGPVGWGGAIIDVYAYDWIKKIIFAMKDRDTASMSSDVFLPTPLSYPLPDPVKLTLLVRAMIDSVVPSVGALLEKSLREKPDVPLSRPTGESLRWGKEGASDGLSDFNVVPYEFQTAAFAYELKDMKAYADRKAYVDRKKA